MITNCIHLDFNKENDLKVPSVQYDSGSRFVKIKLQRNKSPFEIDGYRVTVVANKVDGTEIMNDCTILDGVNGVVQFEITEQFNAVEGVVDCQLKLFKGKTLLTSMPFSINVVKSVSTKEIVSSNELKTLVNALGEVQNIDNRFAQTNAQLSDIKTMVENTTSIDDSTIAIDKTWSSSKTQSMIESIPKGEKGDKGDTGPQGPQGPKGDKGDAGTMSWNDLQDKPNIPSIEGLATTEYVDREVEKTNAQLSKIFNKTVEINVRDFGAKGDGVTDDSQAIRKAIESLPKSNWKLIFPPGTYVQGDGTNPHYTNANGSYGGDVLIGKPIYFEFNGMSNFAIEGYGATIIAHPENSCIVNNRGFSFIRCTNGEIKGLTYNGNIENRRPWGGDNSGYNEQCGFTTSACSYLTFEDCNAYGCVMDGFFIGADGRTVADYSNHIKMIRCQSLRNYRQGLSVVNAHYGVLEDCVFAETGTIYGTDPKAGVDMEQGYTFYEDRGQKCWSIKRCTFRDNAGHGLALHWGTHFATVDDCKFERNSLGCYSDSEYRTRDNQITNCTFIDASIGLEGGGVLFQKNRCYNTDLNVGGKDLYSLGMTRRNEISDNLFRWDWNLEDETITDKIIKTQRRVIFTTPDIIFTRNTLINPTGKLILYCNKKIHEISHNTITSTKDLSSNCDYFGTLNGVSATILKDNYVSSQYQHYDKSYLNCFLKSTNPTDRLFLLTNSFNIGQNHRMDIRICKTSMIIPGMTIHIRFSKNEHYVVTYIAPNNQTIRKISGETTNSFEITRVYANNNDGYSYITLKPTADYYHGVFELELEYPRFYPCGEADSFGFTSERGYVAPENESLVFYKPLLGNVKYSSLPTTDEWLIHEGTQIFYKKLPVWFNGSNWIKADGTIV